MQAILRSSLQQNPGRLHASAVVVGADVRQRGSLETAVHQHDGNRAVHLFEVVGRPAARNGHDAVHPARKHRPDALLLVFFVLHGIDHHYRISVAAGFPDDGAGDVGEIGVRHLRNQ